jgi:hypothetical protein
MNTAETSDMFGKKYDEFAADLLETYPELKAELAAAVAIPAEDRLARYKAEVFATTRNLTQKEIAKTPGMILPGVTLTPAIWETTGKKSRMAVFEYISILNLCVAFHGSADGSPDAEAFTKDWADRVMREDRASMSNIDFDKLSEKFFSIFGTKGDALPPLPEKFLKGKLAKLAEEMVREFKPEDFGFSKDDMEACERDPARAFEILMKGSMGNPKMIQSAMARIAKRLQDKVAKGELKPQELVAEAESLMQEFQSHPAFVELMGAFKSMFGGDMSETEFARASGDDNNTRLSLVRERLRKKLEAKKNARK